MTDRRCAAALTVVPRSLSHHRHHYRVLAASRHEKHAGPPVSGTRTSPSPRNAFARHLSATRRCHHLVAGVGHCDSAEIETAEHLRVFLSCHSCMFELSAVSVSLALLRRRRHRLTHRGERASERLQYDGSVVAMHDECHRMDHGCEAATSNV